MKTKLFYYNEPSLQEETEKSIPLTTEEKGKVFELLELTFFNSSSVNKDIQHLIDFLERYQKLDIMNMQLDGKSITENDMTGRVGYEKIPDPTDIHQLQCGEEEAVAELSRMLEEQNLSQENIGLLQRWLNDYQNLYEVSKARSNKWAASKHVVHGNNLQNSYVSNQ